MQVILMQYSDDHNELFLLNVYNTLSYDLLLNDIKESYNEYWDNDIKKLATKSLKHAIKNANTCYINYNEKNPLEYFIFTKNN